MRKQKSKKDYSVISSFPPGGTMVEQKINKKADLTITYNVDHLPGLCYEFNRGIDKLLGRYNYHFIEEEFDLNGGILRRKFHYKTPVAVRFRGEI